MQYVEVRDMADIPNTPNGSPTGGSDSEKMLQLLEKANDKVSSLSGSIDNSVTGLMTQKKA